MVPSIHACERKSRLGFTVLIAMTIYGLRHTLCLVQVLEEDLVCRLKIRTMWVSNVALLRSKLNSLQLLFPFPFERAC